MTEGTFPPDFGFCQRPIMDDPRHNLPHETVALFLPSLAGGGAERALLQRGGGFCARGMQVDLVLGKQEGAYLSQVPQGVRVVPLQADGTVARVRKLAGYLKRERPAVLLSMLDHVNAAGLARMWAGVQTAVVQGLQNHISMDLEGQAGQGGWKAALKPHVMRQCFAWSDGVIAASHGVAADFQAGAGADFQGSVDVVYNPIVEPSVWERAREAVNHPFFAEGAAPVILGVGRLEKQKDFPTLIRAFAQVRREQPLRLMILGEGSLRGELEQLAQQLGVAADVAMPGFVMNPHAYMARSRVFVLSSVWEGLGNVVIEALAAGTAVVSTDCPSGPAEILEQGKYGRRVGVKDVGAMARAIAQSLAEPADGARQRGRAMAFSVDAAVEGYLKALGRARRQRGHGRQWMDQ
jgi:glycosyltransferase involved in cell wall biosynthesis